MAKARLSIDFESKEKLAEWFRVVRENMHFPEDAGVYASDCLDDRKGGGVTKAHTYLVRRIGDRDESFRLKVSKTKTRAV